MITIVDYGLGNVQAFANIYKRLNISCRAARTPDELAGASNVILPGVGAFDWAMERLAASGMRQPLEDLVLNQKRPVLGICVGMQVMAKSSEEGDLPGLGWIDAEVKLIDEASFNKSTQLPHMGWNDVSPVKDHSLFNGIDSPRFYFLHSYYFAPRDSGQTMAVTDYGGTFTSAVRNDNVFGVQFHPEKSHDWGVRLLRNFAEIS